MVSRNRPDQWINQIIDNFVIFLPVNWLFFRFYVPQNEVCAVIWPTRLQVTFHFCRVSRNSADCDYRNFNINTIFKNPIRYNSLRNLAIFTFTGINYEDFSHLSLFNIHSIKYNSLMIFVLMNCNKNHLILN